MISITLANRFFAARDRDGRFAFSERYSLQPRLHLRVAL